MNRAEHPTAQRWLKRLPLLATALLVMLCAWLVAQLTWALLAPADTSLPSASNPTNLTAIANADRPQAIDLNLLIKQQLFGATEVEKAPPRAAPKPVTTTVSETTLRNLKLVGVLASESPYFARAIIQNGSQPSKVYKIEQEILSGAILNKVALDHVIIERNGKLEILRMKKAAVTTAAARSATPDRNRFNAANLSGVSANNNSAPVGQRLSTARETLLADPSKVTDYLRYRPQMKDGQVVGYRIYPGKDRALFRDVGLRSGDLVKSINGISISDPAQALTLIPQLQTATSATLTIERRGQEQTINVSTQ